MATIPSERDNDDHTSEESYRDPTLLVQPLPRTLDADNKTPNLGRGMTTSPYGRTLREHFTMSGDALPTFSLKPNQPVQHRTLGPISPEHLAMFCKSASKRMAAAAAAAWDDEVDGESVGMKTDDMADVWGEEQSTLVGERRLMSKVWALVQAFVLSCCPCGAQGDGQHGTPRPA
ncbi:hypothetical protein OC861_005716 [Tilletia horrida]|nr:hypothetical protein OC861_005716 [Tilletia horrida]